MLRWIAAFALWLGVLVAPLPARTIYVDNRAGRDVFDGTSPEPVNAHTGPVRSLRRALILAGRGDVIVLKNNTIPYEGSLLLTGARHSGFPNSPFTIVGNGAIIDGSLPIHPESWTRVRGNLWAITPWRKGHYLLLDDRGPLPEIGPGNHPPSRPRLAPGQWTTWKGSMHYHPAPGAPPQSLPLRAAAGTVGVSLYAVENVHIRDLTLQHFRLDGVNAHDLCKNVVLENVTAVANGRAGLAVAGSSDVIVIRCTFANNRIQDIQTTELGRVLIEQNQMTE